MFGFLSSAAHRIGGVARSVANAAAPVIRSGLDNARQDLADSARMLAAGAGNAAADAIAPTGTPRGTVVPITSDAVKTVGLVAVGLLLAAVVYFVVKRS
jgi:hypothetical protein